MFAGFPVLEIDAIVRRTLRASVVAVVIAGAVAWVMHEPLVIPGLVVGLVCAVANHRLFQVSAVRYIGKEGSVARRPFASATLLRLFACSAVGVVLLVLVEPMGWGVLIALALFQFMMLASALLALLAYQRQQGDLDA